MKRSGEKKVNPRRVPVTMADVEKAKKDALKEAIRYAMVIFFTVLLDKHGATGEILRQLWDEVEYLSHSINEGYVSLSDLERVLRDEYDIRIG